MTNPFLVTPPNLSDAQDLLKFVKCLVTIDTERVEQIDKVDKLTIKDEVQWLSVILEKMKSGNYHTLCLRDSNNLLLGFGEIECRPRAMEKHVAELRFGLLPSYVEAGKYLVQSLENIARTMAIKLIYYFHLATQHQGLQVMQNSGYSHAGCLEGYYLKEGIYIDRIYLAKQLDYVIN